MAQSVEGKSAIVTGSGSGINLAFANLLLSRGCNVVLADIALRPEAKQLVEAHSQRQNGTGRAVFQETDVTQWTQLDRMFETAKREFGGIDIVCPGAGVYEPLFSNFWRPPGQQPSGDASNSNHYLQLDINLTHPIRTTQLAIAHFLNAPKPSAFPSNPKSIIHISSVAGQATPLAAPIYNATKHAINGFVRSLAPLEKRVGIRVAAVAPGVIKTPLWTDHPEKLQAIDEKTDKWVTPEDVAEAMFALVEQDQISHVLGQKDAAEEGSITIEGGSIIEVSKDRVRDVKAYHDEGPMGRAGNTVGHMGKLEDEVWELLGTTGWGISSPS